MHLHGRTWGLLLGAAVATIASSAFAEDASYTVVTNDGSTYQGQLVENVVNQHVTIKLASGEIRTFEASDVRSASSTPTATPSEITVPVPVPFAFQAAGGPPVTYDGKDAVHIHVEKADAGEGHLFMETASGWSTVCTTPCTTTVDPKIDYRLYNSDPFRFPRDRGALDLLVDNGARRAFRTAGAVMAPLGAVGIVMGILVAANTFYSGGTANTALEKQAQSNAQNANLAGGLTTIGVSLALMTIGFVFLAVHPSPSLTTRAGDRIAKRGGPMLTPAGLVF